MNDDLSISALIDDLTAAVHELRGAVIRLLADAGVQLTRPQALARQLRLDKSLAWKIAKIVKTDDPAIAVQHLPGSAAFEILVSAAQKSGASPGTVERARSAFAAVERAIELHVDDRPTLELVVDSMPARHADRLLVSRKLAFRGNSGIWGVQARTRLNTAIVFPSRTALDMIDVATIGGWIDFRRLRAESRWALFRSRTYGQSESAARTMHVPIDPDEDPHGPMLMRDYCSPSIPPIQVLQDEATGEVVHELGPSSVGNTGAFTCFFGSIVSNIGSRYEDEETDHGEFGAVVSAPTEALHFDLLVHRECAFVTDAQIEVFGVLSPGPTFRHERDRLPVDVKPTQLGRFPAVVDTPSIPRYAEIIDHVLARTGHARNDFIGVRYALEYPPFPSTVVIRFPLAVRA